MTSSAQRNTCRSNIVRPGGEAFRFRVLSLRPEGLVRLELRSIAFARMKEEISQILLASGSSHAEQ